MQEDKQGRKLHTNSSQETDPVKDEFLANMSHELRSPINAILGMDEMILRESRDDTVTKYALSIQSAGRTLLALVNEILDYSKIEAGNMEIVPARYEIASLIRESYNMIALRANKKDLAVYVENDPQIPSVLFGDEVRLRQIFTNILTNAVKYTKEGHVRMSIGFEQTGADEMLLQLSVEDTGIGIKEEDLQQLFGSFKRFDSLKNRNIEGTGLGLAITKKLVDRMNGTIKVESVYGQGTTFHIAIPQRIEDQEPMGTFSITSSDSDVVSYSYRESFRAPNAKILVVDDAEVNLEVMRGLLKKTEMDIDTALCGSECLAKIKEMKYDLIYMDHLMPEMDGIETLQKMQEIGEHPNKETPVVALTANALRGAKETYLSYGFRDFLAKPVQGIDLEKMTMHYLPPELVQVMPQEAEDTGSFIEQLDFLDTDTGMRFCKDEDAYRDVIRTFAADNRADELEKLFEAKEWETYRKAVRSIKNTAAYIGATRLSGVAKTLEKAVKDGDENAAEQHHFVLVREYHDLLERMRGL
ncbi:MAG: response regulator [Lachnospiraceae bacterium]|nr:response regulator [Lachnospiraceae bacterium]